MVPVEPDYRRRRFDVAFEVHVGTFVDVGNVQVTAQSYFQPRRICVKTKRARVNNTVKRAQSSILYSGHWALSDAPSSAPESTRCSPRIWSRIDRRRRSVLTSKCSTSCYGFPPPETWTIEKFPGLPTSIVTIRCVFNKRPDYNSYR